MTTPDGFAAALRDQLVQAAGREVTRRRRRAKRATALAIALTAGLAGTVASSVRDPRPAAADVVVRVEGDEVTVLLVDLELDPDRIEAVVRSAGLDIEVDGVPVGPSLVGRFLGREAAHARAPELRPVAGDERSFAGFALPVGWPGSLRLQVGVPARGDQPYARFSDATAPGEALACRPIVGRSGADVARELADEDLRVRYLDLSGGGLRPVAASEVLDADGPSWFVAGADGVRDGEVALRLAADDGLGDGGLGHGPAPTLPEGCEP